MVAILGWRWSFGIEVYIIGRKKSVVSFSPSFVVIADFPRDE